MIFPISEMKSDRDGLRVVIELKRDGQPAVFLTSCSNILLCRLPLALLLLALVNGTPKFLR